MLSALWPLALWGVLYMQSPPAKALVTVEATSRSIQPGELVRLSIRPPSQVTAITARAFGTDIPVFPGPLSTWQALVGVDLAVKPGSYKVVIETVPGTGVTTYPLVVKPRRFRTRTLTVDPAFVTPPPEAAERIERETRELNQIWQASVPRQLWDAFVPAVPQAANSAFGTHSVFNGEPRSQHGGADFASPAGTPIKAPASGRVALAASRYFSGNTVVIDHGLGLFSLFAHLSVIGVKDGEMVKIGDEIGRVGSTGRVTGPHLHWAVRVNGARVDPLSVMFVLK